ncbi:MAG: 23S rRNA (adenine(2503)-C(2))-methyltransferase RlmN [Clostridia bacterium]|nr:23S rRNA (adenine(2503)-C(2))-methyltransferase RlmN [Clostridia bacterium]
MIKDISSMYLDEIKELISATGEPAYRAGQVFTGAVRGARSFDEITNIPKSLRERLSKETYIASAEIKKKLVSRDGTIKYLFKLRDGQLIESVILRYKHGNSICVSSQAGCAMGCRFCASTVGGKIRDLTAGEILSQVREASRDMGERISNVVMMGIGEPLDNLDNTVRFIRLAGEKDGLSIGARHISVSTCGLVPKIDELSELSLGVTLSVSLHAPNDDIRSRIMPVNRLYGIDCLIKSCHNYIKKTGRRISFEYAMIEGLNDTPQCADELASLLRGMICHVNLIPINDAREGFRPSSKGTVAAFSGRLSDRGINVTVRRKLGDDIQGSCGQLRLGSRRDETRKIL